MKKLAVFSAFAAVLALVAGCTTVSSAKNFNGVSLGVGQDRPVCHTFVRIPGIYLWGIPVITGSAATADKMAIFRNTLKNENVVYLLTEEVRKQGGTRVLNLQTCETSFWLLGLSISSMQASGTGVRNKDEAVSQAIQNYESMP